MSMIDQWRFGTATRHPAAVCKYWGNPPRSKLSLRPIVIAGRQCYDDGHPPDCWRNVLLPPPVDQTESGSSAERDFLAQAIVLRNSVIMRDKPSNNCWHLLGYELQRGDESAGYLRPNLSPVPQEVMRRPTEHGFPSIAPAIQPRHGLLRTGVVIGLDADGDDVDLIHDRVVQSDPEASAADHLAAMTLAVVVSDMSRGFDLYRSYGHALNAIYPWLKKHGDRDTLMPILDVTSLLRAPREAANDDVVGELTEILQNLHRSIRVEPT